MVKDAKGVLLFPNDRVKFLNKNKNTTYVIKEMEVDANGYMWAIVNFGADIYERVSTKYIKKVGETYNIKGVTTYVEQLEKEIKTLKREMEGLQ